mgnify:CR=1 FL=1
MIDLTTNQTLIISGYAVVTLLIMISSRIQITNLSKYIDKLRNL